MTGRFVIVQETRVIDKNYGSDLGAFTEQDYHLEEEDAAREKQRYERLRCSNPSLDPYFPRFCKAGILEGLVKNDLGIMIYAVGKILDNSAEDRVREKMAALSTEVGLDAAIERLMYNSVPQFAGYQLLQGVVHLLPDTREFSKRGANFVLFSSPDEVPSLDQRKVSINGKGVIDFSILSSSLPAGAPNLLKIGN